MAMIKLTWKQIKNLGLADRVMEWKGWDSSQVRWRGGINDDELIEFDDTFEKIDNSLSPHGTKKYFRGDGFYYTYFATEEYDDYFVGLFSGSDDSEIRRYPTFSRSEDAAEQICDILVKEYPEN